MIQVQIASTLERDGVGAARWVLVDNGEFERYAPVRHAAGDAVAAAATVQTAAGLMQAPRYLPEGGARRAGLGVQVACAAVLLAALAAAWSVAGTLLAASDGGARAALTTAGR